MSRSKPIIVKKSTPSQFQLASTGRKRQLKPWNLKITAWKRRNIHINHPNLFVFSPWQSCNIWDFCILLPDGSLHDASSWRGYNSEIQGKYTAPNGIILGPLRSKTSEVRFFTPWIFLFGDYGTLENDYGTKIGSSPRNQGGTHFQVNNGHKPWS